MRILIASGNRSLVGGTEQYLRTLIPALLERGHEVAFVYERPAATGTPTVDAAEFDLPRWFGPELYAPTASCELANWKPSVLYVHGLVSPGLEQMLLEQYPAVLYAHGYYGTCGTGRKCFGFPTARPCSRQFGVACLALHYPRRCGGLNPWTTLKVFATQSHRNRLLPRYRAVLTASRHMYSEYENHGVAGDRLHLVPLPNSGIRPQTEPPVSGPITGRILFVSRLTDIKGGHYLLKAMGQATHKLGRELTLTVAGTGPERDHLDALAHQLGVPATFEGWVNAERQMELMRSADLLAVPSLWPEPFGLVGLEGGCVGLPAVAYDVGGISDWLIPGDSGELAAGQPPTVAGFADAIVRALSDSSHRARLSRGAWEAARQFTLDTHLSKLEPILQQAASHREASACV